MISDQYTKLYCKHLEELNNEKLMEVRADKEWEIKQINKLLLARAKQ